MRANFVRPSCLTATARFLLRLEMCGNGCPGSNASGVRTGAISRSKVPGRGRPRRSSEYSVGSRNRMPVRRELRPQRVGPAERLLVEHLPRPRPDERQLLLGRQAVGRDVFAVRAHLLLQHGDANHEELVEVGADDGEELDAFEDGVPAIARLVEDAFVEGQPAELAVQIERRGVERGSRRAGRCSRQAGRLVRLVSRSSPNGCLPGTRCSGCPRPSYDPVVKTM